MAYNYKRRIVKIIEKKYETIFKTNQIPKPSDDSVYSLDDSILHNTSDVGFIYAETNIHQS